MAGSEGEGDRGTTRGEGPARLAEDKLVLGHVGQLMLEAAALIVAGQGQFNAVQENEMGLLVGRLYVGLGIAIDRGLIPQLQIYQGRVYQGETMREFMDRFPLERNHPDLKRLFTDVRRPSDAPGT